MFTVKSKKVETEEVVTFQSKQTDQLRNVITEGYKETENKFHDSLQLVSNIYMKLPIFQILYDTQKSYPSETTLTEKF